MRRAPTVVYCAIDPLISSRGNFLPGFEEFSTELNDASVPLVWVTNRSRGQADELRRKFGHNHPFIAEGGCGVYLPEDYFHLRASKTLRLGRFLCIPVADIQPAASKALESLGEEAGISIVALRSLPPRQFAQNSGLSAREAELARQRDFDELFFFAGASEEDVARFLVHARGNKVEVRRRGALWSLAVGSSLSQCLSQLSRLSDRAVRGHVVTFGLGTSEGSDELFAACDRGVVLRQPGDQVSSRNPRPTKIREIPLTAADLWDQVRTMIEPSA